MKKYRFIGTENERLGYLSPCPERNQGYTVDEINAWETDGINTFDKYRHEWEEVIDTDKEVKEILDAVNKPVETFSTSNTNQLSFISNLDGVLAGIRELLISKNKKYGNSALEPLRIFSKASSQEQLKVRIDDKLSRLKTQDVSEDEDVIDDLIGYLVIYKISNGNN